MSASTSISNIHYSELNREYIERPEAIDWLFGRMFSYLHLVQKMSGRAT